MGISSINFSALAQSFQNQQNPQPAVSNSPVPPPNAPGSVGDLENIASQAPQQLGQALQTQNQPQAQQQPAENPYSQIANYYRQQLQQSQSQPQAQGGRLKNLLSNFFVGAGSGMSHQAGLPTPDEKQQLLVHNAATYSQLEDGWNQQQGAVRYRQALTDQLEQNAAFERQSQPLRLQQEQQAVTAGAQNIPTVRPSMTAADLASLGIPGDLSVQFAGHPLSEADMNVVKQLAAANQKSVYDYGADDTGSGGHQGKGIWLVDKQFNPVKQLSPISETSRSTSLARQQMQMQLMQTQSGQTGIDLVEGRLDPSQISPRGPQYPYILNAANQYSQQVYGQPFDFAKAAGDYKYANNTGTKNTLNFLNSLVGPDGKSGNLQELINQSNAIGRTPFPALNDVAAWARLESGSPQIAAYHAITTEVADLVAKVLQGGGSGAGTSDAKMRQAQELFNGGFNRDQVKSVASTLQTLLSNRKTSIIGNNTYLQRQFSPRSAGAASVTQPTAAGGFNWNSYPVVQ